MDKIINNPDIIRKAVSIPYYTAIKYDKLNCLDDLRQDYWMIAAEMGSDTPIPLAIFILRQRLIDRARSRSYCYSWNSNKTVVSIPSFSVFEHNNDDVRTLFIQDIQEHMSAEDDHTDIEVRQYLSWIRPVRLKRIMEECFLNGKTHRAIGIELNLSRSLISKEIKRGVEIIKSRIKGEQV